MEEVLDLEEACKYLKLSKATLYKYVRLGEIPGFKIGRIWRFHKDILDKWMSSRTGRETASRTLNK